MITKLQCIKVVFFNSHILGIRGVTMYMYKNVHVYEDGKRAKRGADMAIRYKIISVIHECCLKKKDFDLYRP